MIAAWVGYCLLISAILAVAALLAERSLSQFRKPVRWVWAGAIAGTLLLPALAYLIPSAFRDAGAPLSIGLLPLQSVSGPPVDALALERAAGVDLLSWLTSAGALLGAVWVGSIMLLAGYLAMTFGRLRGEMRSWTPVRILDAPVLVSPDRGPAVIGLRRSVIVLPRWIAELRDDVLRLIFLHEREHQLAGDQRLFALGVVGTLAMPWNPVMWWLLRRLRLAIEFDCDHRVIAGGVAAREYAEALLEVGSRVSRPPLAAAAFAERRSAVERRLRHMTRPLGALRGPRALVTAAGAALLVGIACRSPMPPASTVDADESPLADAAVQTEQAPRQLDDPSVRPSFIPYDVPPRLTNPDETVETLRAEEPAETFRITAQSVEMEGQVDRSGLDPLYVIDGVVQPPGTTTKQIDRRNIESIEIIKGEAARALYGDRAAHGVISITTRTAAGPTDAELPPPPPPWVLREREPEPTGALPVEPSDALPPEPSNALPLVPTDALPPEPATPGDARRVSELTEALVVIDGVIQADPAVFRDLDPGDIDAIEVLKGGAAVEAYGARGARGVIRITTKKR